MADDKENVVELEPFEHNSEIDDLNEELDKLDTERRKFLEHHRKKAEKLVEKRNRLMMIDELTLRRLSGASFDQREQAWIETNPKEWAKIKKTTEGKVGTRRVQQVAAR